MKNKSMCIKKLLILMLFVAMIQTTFGAIAIGTWDETKTPANSNSPVSLMTEEETTISFDHNTSSYVGEDTLSSAYSTISNTPSFTDLRRNRFLAETERESERQKSALLVLDRQLEKLSLQFEQEIDQFKTKESQIISANVNTLDPLSIASTKIRLLGTLLTNEVIGTTFALFDKSSNRLFFDLGEKYKLAISRYRTTMRELQEGAKLTEAQVKGYDTDLTKYKNLLRKLKNLEKSFNDISRGRHAASMSATGEDAVAYVEACRLFPNTVYEDKSGLVTIESNKIVYRFPNGAGKGPNGYNESTFHYNLTKLISKLDTMIDTAAHSARISAGMVSIETAGRLNADVTVFRASSASAMELIYDNAFQEVMWIGDAIKAKRAEIKTLMVLLDARVRKVKIQHDLLETLPEHELKLMQEKEEARFLYEAFGKDAQVILDARKAGAEQLAELERNLAEEQRFEQEKQTRIKVQLQKIENLMESLNAAKDMMAKKDYLSCRTLLEGAKIDTITGLDVDVEDLRYKVASTIKNSVKDEDLDKSRGQVLNETKSLINVQNRPLYVGIGAAVLVVLIIAFTVMYVSKNK